MGLSLIHFIPVIVKMNESSIKKRPSKPVKSGLFNEVKNSKKI